MTEIKVLHLSDIHGDLELIQAAREVMDLENGVNFSIITGDFISADLNQGNDPTAAVLNQYLGQIDSAFPLIKEYVTINQYVQENNERIKQLPQEEQAKIIENLQNVNSARKSYLEQVVRDPSVKETIENIIEEAYTRLIPELESLGEVYGILGNHDTLHAYNILKNAVTFVEKEQYVSVDITDDVSFTLQGMLNTYEVPSNFAHPLVRMLIGDKLIDYDLGYPIEQHVNQETGEIDEEIIAKYKAETERLNAVDEKNKCDLFLSHKSPGSKWGSSPITKAHARYCTAIACGHDHGLQIEKYKVRNPATGEVEREVPTFNPGRDYVFVHVYNKNKEIVDTKKYRVFERVEEEAA